MSYTEEGDFLEKIGVISDMKLRLHNAKIKLNLEEANILEIGGAGGILGGLLASCAKKIIVSDVLDTQTQYRGEFPKLLSEKFSRNNRILDLSKIEFHVVDAMDLPYRDGLFNFIISNNAFEHIPDPIKAVNEVSRVLRSGGIFYATFDPIWTADSGSHFMHYTKEPWLHLIATDEEYRERMKQEGAAEWEQAEYPFAMNKHHAKYYMEMLPSSVMHNFSIFSCLNWSGCVDPNSNNHINRTIAAKKLGLHPDDLLIRGFAILAVKK